MDQNFVSSLSFRISHQNLSLKRRRDKHMKFGGIIYLSEMNQRKLPLLDKLRKDATIGATVKSVSTKEGKGPLARDTHFADTHKSAWEIIDLVLEHC